MKKKRYQQCLLKNSPCSTIVATGKVRADLSVTGYVTLGNVFSHCNLCHTIVLGDTGSKKSRLVLRRLYNDTWKNVTHA